MKTFQLTLATLVGVASGAIGTATLTARASSEQNRITHVSAEYPASNAAMVAIKAKVDAAQGPLCDAAEGWDAGTCKVQTGTTTCFTWGDPVIVNTDFHNGGTWTKGAPE